MPWTRIAVCCVLGVLLQLALCRAAWRFRSGPLQPLVLRFAAASVLIAVLTLGVGLQQGLSPSYEVAELELELEEETALNIRPEL